MTTFSASDFESLPNNVVGQGTYGVVNRARHKSTGNIVAIKNVPKSKLDTEKLVANLRNEIRILEQNKHPNIVELYGTFVRSPNFMLVGC